MLLNNKLIFINYLNFKYCKFYWLLFLVFYMYIFWPFFGRPKFKTWLFGHGKTAKRPTANSGQTANGQLRPNGQWPTLRYGISVSTVFLYCTRVMLAIHSL